MKEGFGPAYVSESVPSHNMESRIVDPCVGISDVDLERGKLRQRLFFVCGDIQARLEMRLRKAPRSSLTMPCTCALASGGKYRCV